MRIFYLAYQKQQTLSVKSEKAIQQTLSADLHSGTPFRNPELAEDHTVSPVFTLSWSHYLILMRIVSEDERRFYEIEAHKNNWSVRELQRQYDSALYARLLLI